MEKPKKFDLFVKSLKGPIYILQYII